MQLALEENTLLFFFLSLVQATRHDKLLMLLTEIFYIYFITVVVKFYLRVQPFFVLS